MAKSRLELRKMNEAAEAAGLSDEAEESPAPKKKKAAKRKAATRRTREKPPERKRAVWVLYSGSMKEEGRFPYDQKEAAEERLAVLQGRGKKLYFMQLVKELITGAGEVVPTVTPDIDEDEEELKAKKKAAAAGDEEAVDELGDVEVDDADFEDDEEDDLEDDGGEDED